METELERLGRAERMVVSDPEVMRGTPVYRGTRIPVDLIAGMLAAGTTVEEIVKGYPALNREKVELAPVYIRAFPRRGRPVRQPWSKEKAVRVTRHGSSSQG